MSASLAQRAYAETRSSRGLLGVFACVALILFLDWHCNSMGVRALARLWALMYDAFSDRFTFPVFGGWAIIMCIYWLVAAPLLYVDVYQEPASLCARRLPTARAFAIEGSQHNASLRTLLIVVLGNQILVMLPCLFMLQWLFGLVRWPWPAGIRMHRELPSLFTIGWQCALSALLGEPVFYFAHRLLHTKILFARVHKIRHSFGATLPIAAATLYAHPLEVVLCNVLPLALPVFLIGTHVVVWFISIIFEWTFVMLGRSEYDLPALSLLVPRDEFLDVHHQYADGNYGAMGWLDALLGTRSRHSAKRREINVSAL